MDEIAEYYTGTSPRGLHSNSNACPENLYSRSLAKERETSNSVFLGANQKSDKRDRERSPIYASTGS